MEIGEEIIQEAIDEIEYCIEHNPTEEEYLNYKFKQNQLATYDFYCYTQNPNIHAAYIRQAEGITLINISFSNKNKPMLPLPYYWFSPDDKLWQFAEFFEFLHPFHFEKYRFSTVEELLQDRFLFKRMRKEVDNDNPRLIHIYDD